MKYIPGTIKRKKIFVCVCVCVCIYIHTYIYVCMYNVRYI